jgi:hypothetical protein
VLLPLLPIQPLLVAIGGLDAGGDAAARVVCGGGREAGCARARGACSHAPHHVPVLRWLVAPGLSARRAVNARRAACGAPGQSSLAGAAHAPPPVHHHDP